MLFLFFVNKLFLQLIIGFPPIYTYIYLLAPLSSNFSLSLSLSLSLARQEKNTNFLRLQWFGIYIFKKCTHKEYKNKLNCASADIQCTPPYFLARSNIMFLKFVFKFVHILVNKLFFYAFTTKLNLLTQLIIKAFLRYIHIYPS